MIPNSPIGAVTLEVARAFRLLKSLPDEDYLVWHRLGIWDQPGPDFLILKGDRRVALLKISRATPRDVRRVLQPELLSSGKGNSPMGVKEQEELETFRDGLLKGVKDTGSVEIPLWTGFPNLSERDLRVVVRTRPPEGVTWLSKDLLKPEDLPLFAEDHLSSPLSEGWTDRIRAAFTPEAVIPREFTVRERITRNTEAELTDFLFDYDQEWVLKCDLEWDEEVKRLSQDFGVRLINGVAGSGKSLIIVYRTLLLRRLFPKKRILVLTHNRPLIHDLERRYLALSQRDRGVEWRTFLSWCFSLHPNQVVIEDRIGRASREKLIREVWSEHLADTAVTATMLESEIDWFKDRLVTRRSEYLTMDRSGRGFALQESIRQRVFDAMGDYSERLLELGKIDWGDVPRRVWGMLQSGEIDYPQYDVILVDEAQFFAPIWFEIIKKMLHPQTGHLFLVADPTQGFLKRGQSWLASGLEVRGRSHRMERSYRTTREILDYATYLYRSRVVQDEEDIVVPNLEDMPAGVVPVVVPMTSPQDEITRVVAEIEGLVREGVPKEYILVIHEDWRGAETVLSRLNAGLGEGSAVDPKEGIKGSSIRVCSLNAATGLESPIVFLVGMNSLFEQEQSLRISDEERVELIRDNTRKIYMAITRAGQRVVITYCGELPEWLKEAGKGFQC